MPVKIKRSGRISIAGLFLLFVILLAGTAAGVAAYMFWPRGDEVFAYIRVSMSPESIVYEKEPIKMEDYEVFKNTQIGLLKSPYVFMAALRKKKIGSLSIVKQEIDPISWLQDELEVEYLDNSEIMKVSITSKKPKEAAELVNAIVNAYIEEVVDKQSDERRAMIAQLDQIFNSKEREVRSKRASLISLEGKLGITVDGTPSVKAQLNLQRYELYLKKLLYNQLELQQAKANWKNYEATLARIDEPDISALISTAADKLDTITSNQDKDFSRILKQWDDISAQSDTARLPKKLQADMKAFRRQFIAWHTRVLDERRTEAMENIFNSRVRVEVLSERIESLESEVKQCEQSAQEAGHRSVDVEMMREEIKCLEESLRIIAAKREKLKIESRARPRIICEQEAIPPEMIISGYGLMDP